MKRVLFNSISLSDRRGFMPRPRQVLDVSAAVVHVAFAR